MRNISKQQQDALAKCDGALVAEAYGKSVNDKS
jgi:hypothetical protein